jgi:hypothetical protein
VETSVAPVTETVARYRHKWPWFKLLSTTTVLLYHKKKPQHKAGAKGDFNEKDNCELSP